MPSHSGGIAAVAATPIHSSVDTHTHTAMMNIDHNHWLVNWTPLIPPSKPSEWKSYELRFCNYDTLLMHKWFGNEKEILCLNLFVIGSTNTQARIRICVYRYRYMQCIGMSAEIFHHFRHNWFCHRLISSAARPPSTSQDKWYSDSLWLHKSFIFDLTAVLMRIHSKLLQFPFNLNLSLILSFQLCYGASSPALSVRIMRYVSEIYSMNYYCE